jgi:homoserine dehydrogenase
MTAHTENDFVRVAILGAGNVGGALVNELYHHHKEIGERTGIAFDLVGVAVRHPDKGVASRLPKDMVTTDPLSLVTRDDVDIVVELMGGIEPAHSLIRAALESGRSVVTANKALLAAHGPALALLAQEKGVDLLYEASVGGAIPIIRALRTSLAGERVKRVMGIVNGTTNYILSEMTDNGLDYEEALAQATALGYAEADPSADVDGHDAAAKAAILAALAFGVAVQGELVHREGIAHIRAIDVENAKRLGYVIKLLATAEKVGDTDKVSVRVHPVMLHHTHPLASVRGAFNAVFVEGESCGEMMLYGQGAGGTPTASAVLGDLLDAARNFAVGRPGVAPRHRPAQLAPIAELHSAFHLRLDVLDQPGVLAAVAKVFGDHGISIRAMEQDGLGEGARLTFLTHLADEGQMAATIKELSTLGAVSGVGAVLRVIGTDEGPLRARGANR